MFIDNDDPTLAADLSYPIEEDDDDVTLRCTVDTNYDSGDVRYSWKSATDDAMTDWQDLTVTDDTVNTYTITADRDNSGKYKCITHIDNSAGSTDTDETDDELDPEESAELEVKFWCK